MVTKGINESYATISFVRAMVFGAICLLTAASPLSSQDPGSKKGGILDSGTGTYRTGTRRPRAAEAALPGQVGDPTPKLRGDELFDYEFEIEGYVDVRFYDREGEKRRFELKRFVPEIEGMLSPHVFFSVEVELEDGAEEITFEKAVVEYQPIPEFAVSAGVHLVPLGRVNLYHDGPELEFTDRPLVDRFIIPSTYRDAGLGFRGRLGSLPGDGNLEASVLIHGGLRGQDADGTYLIDRTKGFRRARTHLPTGGGFSSYEDNNGGATVTARLEAEGPGYRVGLSGLHGSWDLEGRLDLDLAVLDVDTDSRLLPSLEASIPGRLLFRGQVVWGRLERDAAARAGGVPGGVGGGYLQVGWRLPLSSGKSDGIPKFFDEEASLTFLLRGERVELDGARLDRNEFSINFRPNGEMSVIRFGYQWNLEGGSTPGARNNAFVASFTTSF